MTKPFVNFLIAFFFAGSVGGLKGFSQVTGFYATGTVYDSLEKVSLPNVNISAVGSSQGGTTNADGYFRIKLDKSPSILYFSYMGYKVMSRQVTPLNSDSIVIFLSRETKKIGEVVISGARIQKTFRGDSLHIVDYEILDNRILMVAYPFKHPKGLRIYLATLNGDTISSRLIKKAGKEIRFREFPFSSLIYFFKDCYGRVHFLTSERAWQIYIVNNKIYFLYPSTYPEFMGLLVPMKHELNGNLFYQVSTVKLNETCCYRKGDTLPTSVKLVHDEFGDVRYRFPRCVSAPILKRNEEIIIFDFFASHMEFFNEKGISEKTVPISFHQKLVIDWLGRKTLDLDQLRFSQQILMDDITGKAYGIWKDKANKRVSLQEINLDTGEVVRTIEINDHPNIDKVRLYDNAIYFLYNEKVYPYYQCLFRMVI